MIAQLNRIPPAARRALCLCLLALVSPTALAAQQKPAPGIPLTHLSLEELGNIEVTSVSKEPQILLQSPAAVHVITQEDIRRSGATSLPEVLRLAPGLNIGRIDSGHWSVGVRGFGDQFSKSLLVLIDGRSVYTPLFAGIYWAVEDLLLEDVDRIEVIRGPGGTIWGANAVNGVINIITKSADETTGMLVSAAGGNVDRGIAGVRYGGKRGRLAYRVYGKTFNRGPQFHTDGRDFDEWHMGQSGFRADWTHTSGMLTFQGDVYKGEAGQSVVTGSLSPPADITSYEPVELSGGNLLARWDRKLASGGQVQFQTFYDRTFLLGPQIGETRNTFDVDFVHHLPVIRRHDLRWGLGMRVSPSRIRQTMDGLDVLPHEHTGSTFSGFVEDRIGVVEDRLWLTVGSKLEHNSYTGAEAQPSVRMLWKLNARQSLWAAGTRAVRTPSRLEDGIQLYRFLAANPPTFLQVVGNGDFRSERLLGYEGGFRSAIADRLFVDVAVFHNQHDDLQSFGAGTVRVDTSPQTQVVLVVPYDNTILGASNGFEIAPDWKPATWMQVKSSYSYLRIDLRNTLPDADPFTVVETYEGSSPRHRVAVRPRFTLAKGWEFDQTYRYISALPARAVEAYHSFDMRLGWRGASGVELALVGQNLLQDHHVEYAHDPPPSVGIRRSVYVSVTWRR